jgi:hypothetical protein
MIGKWMTGKRNKWSVYSNTGVWLASNMEPSRSIPVMKRNGR